MGLVPDPLARLGRLPAARGRRAAVPRFLNGGAGHISVRAKHAAIALERAQHLSAVLAVVEELTSVRRHCLDRHTAALRAGKCRGELGHAPASKFISGFSRYDGHRADSATKILASESITGVARVGGATAQLASVAQSLRFRK